ncbi:MAG: hypothetical protein R3345_07975 [Fulvivirga sp.]|nr:hypothetical protein [Fulvivirga sp.]
MEIKNPESFHNKLSFIFHGMLALPLAAFVYLFLEIKDRDLTPAMDNEVFIPYVIGILLFISTAMVVYGYYRFRRHLREARNKEGLKTKLETYYGNAVIFYAFVEFASVLLVVGLYLTTSSFFIVGFMFLLLMLSLNRPTPQKYISDLHLADGEKDIILHKKSFDEDH